ncbi:hypothetical protein [Pseudomonas sp. dw_358]|nr:hypothetical protein [Pseudomonas sp. dw_358]
MPIPGTLLEFKVALTATPFTLWGMTLAIFLAFLSGGQHRLVHAVDGVLL